MSCNLSAAVYRHGLSRPDCLAVSSHKRSVTYAEAAKVACSIAACLKRSPAWSADDDQTPRVGILASRSVDACLGVLGACWAGATYVPLGLSLPTERLLTVMSLCRLSALIADSDGAKLLNKQLLSACPPLVLLPSDAQPPTESHPGVQICRLDSIPNVELSQPAKVAPNHLAYIIFTSGTTGVPKGVMVSSRSVRHFVDTITPLLGLTEDDRALEVCELTFDVSVHNMFATWQAGASLHVLPAVRVMSAVKFARERRLTVWSSVPSLVGALRQVKALSPNSLPDLRLSVFAGEPLPQTVTDAWRVAAPNSVIENLYGPTEATVYCLRKRVETPFPLTPGRDFCAIGLPLPGSEAAVLDSQGAPVAPGVTGELAIAGVQLADGYLDATELTRTRFPTLRDKRWYLTGDLAMQDDSGTFHCLGRIDNQVKVRGYRIELEEVDAHLRLVANAAIVATVAWPIVSGNAQGLVAFVNAQSVDQHSIVTQLKTKLPDYMIPARIIATAEIPFSASGKVDRKALRQRLEKATA